MYREKEEVVVRVRDHGIGIPAEEQERIFEKFYRVTAPENQSIPGSGLGLTLVSQIARAHGGSISVEHTDAMPPVHMDDDMQYLPTPLELPWSPGWPHSEYNA